MKIFSAILLSTFVITACSVKSSSLSYEDYLKHFDVYESEDFKSLKKEILNNYSGYENLKTVTGSLNHRYAGSENGRKAEEFIYNRLKSLGLEVEYRPFKMNLWKRKQAVLSVNTPGTIDNFDTVSFAYTPRISDVKADIIDLGEGLDADFSRVGWRLKGKIALVNLFLLGPRYDLDNQKIGNPHRTVKARMAFDKGAVGIIFVNRYYGMVLSTGTVSTKNDEPLKIPAVCVSIEDGLKIRSYLESGVYTEGHILVESSIEKAEASNVVGRIPGLEKPGERVIIGGHLDTWDLGQGAVDNGVGSFSILDIARAFKSNYVYPRRTVEFIFWMGEEHGLLGSKDFIKKEIERGTVSSIKYYLNIDMQGNPRGFDVEGREMMSDVFKTLGEKAIRLGVEFENMGQSKPTMGAYSDDLIFSIQGIPVLQPMSGLDPVVYKYYHSNRDNFQLVKEDHMKASSLLMGLALYRVANLRIIPAQVLSIEDTESFFVEHGGARVLTPEYNWDLRKKAVESPGIKATGNTPLKSKDSQGRVSN